MLAHVREVFLVNQVLDPGLTQAVLCAYKSTRALEPRAKDSGKEVVIEEGGRSYLEPDASENSYTLVRQICFVKSLRQSWCKFIIPNR